MERVDAVVVGGGVVGLAVARDLARAGFETILLEAAAAIGTETSSRNSEVIHAGMYYPTGSLKARSCVEGRKKLYAYCAERKIAQRKIGKLIVAVTNNEIAKLEAIAARAAANGLIGEDALVPLSGAEAQAMEPALNCVAALYSPSTGIIDSHALMLSFRGEFEAAQGAIAFKTRALGARCLDDGFRLSAQIDGGDIMEIGCRMLINSAGHHASIFARAIDGLQRDHVPDTLYSRGCYFTLSGKAPFEHLIYPVPDEVTLGIHLTIDLGGQAKFGPDQEWIDAVDYAVDPGRAAAFYGDIRRYFPALAEGALQPAYAGVRPKLQRPGEGARDFMIQGPADHGIPGLVNLFGIESPGLTASLALAGHVLEKLEIAN